MAAVSTLSGPVPRGLRLAFAVLTVLALALAIVAAVREVWFLTVICGIFGALNLGVLWTTRTTAPRA
jgi:hypothetical protein